MNQFFNQISEDIKALKNSYGANEPLLAKDEYAFNYWVLTKLFNVDEEVVSSNITEYRDDGVDCYVFFEELKELYLIQCKYYGESTKLDATYVKNDFLVRPLTTLANNSYKRSIQLQEIFNKFKNDGDFKLYLYLYVSNDIITPAVTNAFDKYRCADDRIGCYVEAKLFSLSDIKECYFEDRKEGIRKFNAEFYTRNKGTVLNINSESYNLPHLIDAKYILTPVSIIYEIVKSAKDKNYLLFAENIREYLGNKGVNAKIAKTLQDKNDRANFFYYNNGITVICDDIKEEDSRKVGYGKKYIAKNPQIVNGCQTVNSIYEMLSRYHDSDIEQEFQDTFVMVKLLVLDASNDVDRSLYENIVRYNNSQNAIKDKDFVANQSLFYNMQKDFQQRGFLLAVKQSDKNKFKGYDFNKIRPLLTSFVDRYELSFNRIEDIVIPLEKLLQVILAVFMDGYYVFTKKSSVLKVDSSIHERIIEFIKNGGMTTDNLIELYLLYLKAEKDKENSEDGKTPIPFYMLGFIGKVFQNCLINLRKEKCDMLFASKLNIDVIYDFYAGVTRLYKSTTKIQRNVEYNIMIKQPIDNDTLFLSIAQEKELTASPEKRKTINEFQNCEQSFFEN